ncbi:MAG: hypothetical protein ACRD5B_14560 [Nitrososphaeraceae archaeon]
MNKSIFVGMVISALASTGEKDILSVYNPNLLAAKGTKFYLIIIMYQIIVSSYK